MRSQWKLTLDAAKDEALLAVDLYNQPKRARRLEGFFVHMHMAWLYLFLARYQRDKLEYHYRLPSGRYDKVDGENRTWDLTQFAKQRWQENDPVRRNLELTIALRHKIEHRFAEATAIATAGYAQALLLNFENELTNTFGQDQSLGDDLRFPVFVGTLTRDGAARMAAAQMQLPSKTRKFLARFHADLDAATREDQRYEFRVNLVAKKGPKGDSDLAMTFIREDELTDDQRRALTELGQTGTVVVREQIRDVSNADKMKPSEVSQAIEDRLPFKFSVHSHFARAWKKLDARPLGGGTNPERTKVDYCVYDRAHKDYLYTAAFVDKVVSECSTEDSFAAFTGIAPVRKTTAIHSGQLTA